MKVRRGLGKNKVAFSVVCFENQTLRLKYNLLKAYTCGEVSGAVRHCYAICSTQDCR